MTSRVTVGVLLTLWMSQAWAAPAAVSCHLPTYLAAIDVPLSPEGLERCGGTTIRLLDYVYATDERLYIRARAVAGLGYLGDPRTSTALRGVVLSKIDGRLRSQAVITLARAHWPEERSDITVFLGEHISDTPPLVRATIFRELERMSWAMARPHAHQH